MMNTRVKVILSLAAVVVVAGTIAYWSDQPATPRDQSQSSAHEVPAVQAVEKDKALKQQVVQIEQAEAEGDDAGVAMGVRAFAEELGGRAGKVLTMAADRNLPVKMYGRVIDQNGQPVGGAKVHALIAGGGTYAPGSGLRLLTTDAAGRFVLEGQGQEVAILDVEHPKLANLEFLSEGGVSKTRSAGLKAVSRWGEQFSWRTYDSPENPYVIRVWRVGKFEKVVAGSSFFRPPPDGTRTKQSERVGIVATCLREPKEPDVHWQHQKGSWSITFRPIGGGIQQTDDFYLNEAPKSGYRSELVISMQRGDPRYQPFIRRTKSFYYNYLEDGNKIYGSIEASFNPFIYENKCQVSFKYKFNPKGSRNLAVRRRR